jgi:hypothetical protein
VYLFADLLIEYGLLLMVGAEGIEPSTSSASRKHSSTELRAYSLKPIYIKYLDSMCQHSRVFSKHPHFRDKETVRQADSSARGFSPARKIHLFLGSLSSSRNPARSPPDGFLTSLPDCFFVTEINLLSK